MIDAETRRRVPDPDERERGMTSWPHACLDASDWDPAGALLLAITVDRKGRRLEGERSAR